MRNRPDGCVHICMNVLVYCVMRKHQISLAVLLGIFLKKIFFIFLCIRVTYVQVLPDDPSLDFIGELCVGETVDQEVQRLSWGKMNVGFSVYRFVVHFR